MNITLMEDNRALNQSSSEITTFDFEQDERENDINKINLQVIPK